MSYSMCLVSRIEIQKSIELGIHASYNPSKPEILPIGLKYFLLYA